MNEQLKFNFRFIENRGENFDGIYFYIFSVKLFLIGGRTLLFGLAGLTF